MVEAFTEGGAGSPSPEGRAESREARTGVGPLAPLRPASGRPASSLPTSLARDLRKRLTSQEARLWTALRALRPAGLHFRRQVPVARFIVDFACLKRGLVVEVDGGQHCRDDRAARDRARDDALGALGLTVLRFWNVEVDGDLRAVVDTIVARADGAQPHPGSQLRRDSALPSGEGGRAREP